MPITMNDLQGIWEIAGNENELKGKIAIKNELINLMTYRGLDNIECYCGELYLRGVETVQLTINPHNPMLAASIIEVNYENNILSFTLNDLRRNYRRIIDLR